jgi:hypothetical protein
MIFRRSPPPSAVPHVSRKAIRDENTYGGGNTKLHIEMIVGQRKTI